METNEKIQILSDLIQFDSRNGNERPVAEYLKVLFAKHGIQSSVLPLDSDPDHRANLVAEIGSGNPVIAFTGHMDVVDFDRDQWDTNPLELTIDGDKMFGRGVSDMKSGLAAAAIAFIEIKEQDMAFNGTLRFLATAGEEVGMAGSTALQAAGYMNDVDALIVGEPTGYYTSFANKGELNITLSAKGKAAHSSTPQLGINAIQELMDVWADIKAKLDEKSQKDTNQYLGQDVYNVDVITGGSQPNILPATAEAQLNVRTVPEFDNKAVLAIIDDAIATYNANHQGEVSREVTMEIIPIEGDLHSKLIEEMQAIAKEAVGQDIKAVAAPGGTDASRLLVNHPVGFPMAVFGPGNFLTAHQNNEECSKDMYLKFIEMYTQLFTTVSTEY
ncbi:ArgE/DapE family deacylase [Weissella viridescens]|uniref:Probable succinyl-diaminopimelate desuccinylase n=1 Tax=Weissella viridescens TaxID=1629 RepID=A0A3P2RIT3_WEIVI|nr:ArgE/DapE family deacylase [Weissella viridescens]RRG17632.1 ArgE/DapE family deacylase [Weissella viridescens]